MRKAVSDEAGTARLLKSLNLGICGKTGTAQTSGKAHGWFIGFFPYNEPQYTICIFLENGGSSYQALLSGRDFLKKAKDADLL